MSRIGDAGALWRGDAMAGIGGDWFDRMRDSLAEERTALLAERITWDLDLGRHALVTGELAGLLALYPHDETLIACQMTALYRSGRPIDAQDLYRQTGDPPGAGAGRRAQAGAG